MPVGSISFNVYQQEHEDCQACGDGNCECPLDAEGDCIECVCDPVDFGNTFEMHWCHNCEAVLKGIEAFELAQGCKEGTRRPPCGELMDMLWDLRHDNVSKYIEMAVHLTPDLKNSEYLAKLNQKLFGEFEESAIDAEL